MEKGDLNERRDEATGGVPITACGEREEATQGDWDGFLKGKVEMGSFWAPTCGGLMKRKGVYVFFGEKGSERASPPTI